MRKSLLIIVSLSITIASVYAKNSPISESRQAQFSYSINTDTEINIKGKDTYLKIDTWNKNEVSIIATIEFKGKESAAMRDFLDSFSRQVENKITEFGRELIIDTDLEVPNKVQVGSRIAGIVVGYNDDDLKISYEIKLPAANDLSIKNSYQDLIMNGNFSGDVTIDHYSGDLSAGSFNKLDLKLKYGTAELQRVSKSEMELYEQKLKITELGDARIEVKYSKLNFDIAQQIEMESYESRIEIGRISEITGELKYGRLEILERVDQVGIKTYELEFIAQRARYIKFLESKYSDMEIGEVEFLEYLESYEDEIKVADIGKFTMQNGKYSEIKIGFLTGLLNIEDGYECEVNINNLANTTEEIYIDGKYNELELTSNDVRYSIEGNIQYGKIEFNDDKLERVKYIKDGDHLEMLLKPRNASEDKLLKIILKGYEMKAYIN